MLALDIYHPTFTSEDASSPSLTVKYLLHKTMGSRERQVWVDAGRRHLPCYHLSSVEGEQ